MLLRPGRTSLSRHCDLVFISPTTWRPCKRMRLHRNPSASIFSLYRLQLQALASLLQTLRTCATQLTCSRSTARLHHSSQTQQRHALAPWLRWQQACPQVQMQRPRILRNWRHGPFDDARRAAGVDPSRCSSHSVPDAMIPETRATQPHTRTQRRRARGRGRRQGRGHGYCGAGEEGHQAPGRS